MRINGRQIAANIYEGLQKRVGELQKRSLPAGRQVTPHLTVILIGDDPASISYVSQKQKWAEHIGAKTTILNYPISITSAELEKKIHELNNNPTNHATLIQRPVPPHINIQKLELLVNPQKDIDGFHPNSPYTFPLPLAVIKILKEIYKIKLGGVTRAESSQDAQLRSVPPNGGETSSEHLERSKRQDPVINWLKSQNILVLGKGPTGGGPIIEHLTQLGLHPTLIDSKTKNPDELTKKADIIITAVGKPSTISSKNIKKGVALIGVGIARGSDGKLHGDYDEQDIKDIAAFYTPTPGGVGPVNVAMLLYNLIEATEKQIKNNKE